MKHVVVILSIWEAFVFLVIIKCLILVLCVLLATKPLWFVKNVALVSTPPMVIFVFLALMANTLAADSLIVLLALNILIGTIDMNIVSLMIVLAPLVCKHL